LHPEVANVLDSVQDVATIFAPPQNDAQSVDSREGENMRPRIFTVLSALSLVLCVVTAWEWATKGGVWAPWPWYLPQGPSIINQGTFRGMDYDWMWGTILGFKFVVHFGIGGMDGRWLIIPGWLALAACVPLFAGGADDSDSSHFIIKTTVDGQPKVIDGWLQTDNTVKMQVRDVPAKSP